MKNELLCAFIHNYLYLIGRNCCFSTDHHLYMLSEEKINVLPYILLPLCGPEEFDTDVSPNSKKFKYHNSYSIKMFKKFCVIITFILICCIDLGYGRNA